MLHQFGKLRDSLHHKFGCWCCLLTVQCLRQANKLGNYRVLRQVHALCQFHNHNVVPCYNRNLYYGLANETHETVYCVLKGIHINTLKVLTYLEPINFLCYKK